MSQKLIVVEIDVPRCSLTYGTSPCTAAIGVTGADRCFNTIRTCQDRENYTRETKVLRLCQPSEDIPLEYDAIPCLRTVSVTPGVVDPGRSIGMRANVSISCDEFPTSDGWGDKYTALRAYDPFRQGTFWAKFRARVRSMEGFPLRVLRGRVGDALNTFEVEHYIVDSAISDADGISITAKDFLALCDFKKARAPAVSTGRLDSALSDVATSVDLRPAGIGDVEYPASGLLCLSGKEVVAFTRSGDTLTLTRNTDYGTTPIDHAEDSVAQLVLQYDGETVAFIVHDLLSNYVTGIDPAWMDLPAWEADAATYIGHLYSGIITAPTEVDKLLNEIISQAGVSLWADPAAEQIRFQSLRPVTPSATVYSGDLIVGDSLSMKEQPKLRASAITTYYGLRDPTNKTDKESNFQGVILSVDDEAAVDFELPAFVTNYSRWITILNRAAAERLNNMQLARFRDAPRKIGFTLHGDTEPPAMGEGILVEGHMSQAADGSATQVPAIVTSVAKQEASTQITAEELNFSNSLVPDDERSVFIDTDQFNLDLRELHDSLYGSLPEGAVVSFYIAPGAYVGSSDTVDGPSIDVGAWPEVTDGYAEIHLYIATSGSTDSKVLGPGGKGGGYPGPTLDGQDGGTAIYTRVPITIHNYGTIGAGGGGGPGVILNPFTPLGGGGGAGFNGYKPVTGSRVGGAPGLGTVGAEDAEYGTTTVGGEGATAPVDLAEGGEGGDIGSDGEPGDTGTPGGSSGSVGDEGVAIDGISYVTFDPMGTVTGDTIN